MKIFTAIILFSMCSFSFAEGEVLAKAKEHALSNINKRINYLNELKSCISNAPNKEGMKACRETHKSQLKTLKDTNKAWRESKNQERKRK